MRFRSEAIAGLLCNEGDVVGRIMRSIDVNKRLILSQGFGIPQHGESFPLRFLAYIVPVLHLLYQLPRNALAEFYFATQGMIRANGNSPWWHSGNLSDQVLRMASVIRNYVAFIHPELLTRIRVLHDRVIYPDSPTEQFVEKLAKIATSAANDKVLKFAEKRGGKNALRYMAEHCLYMRDMFSLEGINAMDYLLVPDMSRQYDELIMVGGPAERIFHELRQAICQLVGGKVSCQLFTPIGNPPTYHPQQDEPLWNNWHLPNHPDQKLQGIAVKLLDQTSKVTREMGVRQAVLRDLLVLLNDAGGSKDFRWCGPAATALDKGRSPELPTEVLQSGWSLLRSIRNY